MQLKEQVVKLGKHEIKVHELTVADEASIKSQAQVYNPKKKMHELDQATLDAAIIVSSIVKETWPEEFGSLSIENVKHLPTRYMRPILAMAQSLNVLQEETADFLDSQSSSQTSQTSSRQQ